MNRPNAMLALFFLLIFTTTGCVPQRQIVPVTVVVTQVVTAIPPTATATQAVTPVPVTPSQTVSSSITPSRTPSLTPPPPSPTPPRLIVQGIPGQLEAELQFAYLTRDADNTPVVKTEILARVFASDKKGGKDGEGVDSVEFYILDFNTNAELYTRIERNAPFCLFGDTNSVCNTLSLIGSNRWPDSGKLIQDGLHRLRVRVNNKKNNDSQNESIRFRIQR